MLITFYRKRLLEHILKHVKKRHIHIHILVHTWPGGRCPHQWREGAGLLPEGNQGYRRWLELDAAWGGSYFQSREGTLETLSEYPDLPSSPQDVWPTATFLIFNFCLILCCHYLNHFLLKTTFGTHTETCKKKDTYTYTYIQLFSSIISTDSGGWSTRWQRAFAFQ